MREGMEDRWQRVVDALYEAAWDACRWHDALRQLADFFHCAEGCYVRPDPDSVEGFCVLASTWRDGGCVRVCSELQGWRSTAEISTPPPIWYVPSGLRSTMVLKLPGPFGQPGYICLERGIHQRRFDERDMALAQRIAPDLVRAARLHLRISDSRWQQQICLAGDDAGCLLLDGVRHEVLRANDRALALLAETGAPLALLPARSEATLGRLHAPVGKAGPDVLAQLLGQALRPGSEGGECMLRSHGAIPNWHAHAAPVPQPLEWGLGLRRPVYLMLRPLQACPPPNSRRMQALFGLSPKEAAIAALLAEGMALKQVAERLGIGLSTARTHLVHIFDKTGARNQSALVALMVAGPGRWPADNSAPSAQRLSADAGRQPPTSLLTS